MSGAWMPTDHGVRPRGFLVLSLVILVGLFEITGMAVAARPAKTSEAMQMSSFHPPKWADGFLVQGLISRPGTLPTA
jgi:hypothetical protein